MTQEPAFPSADPESNQPASLPPGARELRKTLKRARQRAERKAAKLQADLAACDQAPRLRRQGELIKANLNALKRGMREAVVTDYFSPAPGARTTIFLDASRPPRETMEKNFKKAAKLTRGRAKIEAVIQLNKKRLGALNQLLADFDKWAASGETAELPAAILARAKALRLRTDKPPLPSRKPRPKPREAKASCRQRLRVFSSLDGLEILVGRSGADNDALTFRLARGNDWWLHVAATPGSHVVVRAPRGESLPQETLLDAAHLAVYYSKMRAAAKADVILARASQVRRIKGAPPGKVRVERSRTIPVRMEANRLARLVKTSLGD